MLINNKIKQSIGWNRGKPKWKENKIINSKIRQELNKDERKISEHKKKKKKFEKHEIWEIINVNFHNISKIENIKITNKKDIWDHLRSLNIFSSSDKRIFIWLYQFKLKIEDIKYTKTKKPIYVWKIIEILDTLNLDIWMTKQLNLEEKKVLQKVYNFLKNKKIEVKLTK